MTVFVRIVRFNRGLGVDCSFVLLWDLYGEVGWSLGEIEGNSHLSTAP